VEYATAHYNPIPYLLQEYTKPSKKFGIALKAKARSGGKKGKMQL
jgi:hypothetical protein